MNMIYKKQGIGIALGIFVFAVSMVLMSGDGLFVSKVSAQGVNSTAAQEPADNMDQIIAKFKEIVNQNGINTTALTIPNNLDISEELQKVVAAKVIPAVSDALNQALDQAGDRTHRRVDARRSALPIGGSPDDIGGQRARPPPHRRTGIRPDLRRPPTTPFHRPRGGDPHRPGTPRRRGARRRGHSGRVVGRRALRHMGESGCPGRGGVMRNGRTT